MIMVKERLVGNITKNKLLFLSLLITEYSLSLRTLEEDVLSDSDCGGDQLHLTNDYRWRGADSGS